MNLVDLHTVHVILGFKVHNFTTVKASKQRLAELTRQAVPLILAATAIVENLPGN